MATERKRVVLGWRDLDTGKKIRRDEQPMALLWNAEYERLPQHVDAQDHEAIRRHYKVDEVIEAPVLPWCQGIAIDGPMQGKHMYAVRQVGAETGIREGRYVVTDDAPSVVPMRFVPDPN